jgi:hypothetical protein
MNPLIELGIGIFLIGAGLTGLVASAIVIYIIYAI